MFILLKLGANGEHKVRAAFAPKHPLQVAVQPEIAPLTLGRQPVSLMLG
jgi:hypothetical protein